MSQEFPGYNSASIEAHQQWYCKYVSLMEKKKQALNLWKDHKVVHKSKSVEAVPEVPVTTAPTTEKQEEAQRKRELVTRWKEERQQQLQQEESRKEEETQREQEEKQRKKKAMQQFWKMQKEKLILYHQQKESEDKLRSNAEQQLQQPKIVDLQPFQERDRQLLEEKRKAKVTKQQQVEKQQEVLHKLAERVKVNSTRDPSRLTLPTQAWHSHTIHTNDSNSAPFGSAILHKRSIPTWRQGLQ